jgi:hypothetical protein
MSYYGSRRYNPPSDVYAASTIIGPFTGSGKAEATTAHGGFAISQRTGGALLRKINDALAQLEAVPLERRDELWAAAVGGAKHARDLLEQGRRAKAGKVLASAKELINAVPA